MVSIEIIQKFKSLYQSKFNVEITDEQATKMTNDLVNLMEILLKPESEGDKQDNTSVERRVRETQSI